MAFQHGKQLTISVDDSAGTPRSLETYVTDVSLSSSRDTAETTVLAATGDSKTYIAGFEDATVSISGYYDATADGYLYGLFGTDNTATFSYSPDAGTTTYSGEALITSYNVEGSVGGAASIAATLQVTGVVTRT